MSFCLVEYINNYILLHCQLTLTTFNSFETYILCRGRIYKHTRNQYKEHPDFEQHFVGHPKCCPMRGFESIIQENRKRRVDGLNHWVTLTVNNSALLKHTVLRERYSHFLVLEVHFVKNNNNLMIQKHNISCKSINDTIPFSFFSSSSNKTF